jgi:hypothetical protein
MVDVFIGCFSPAPRDQCVAHVNNGEFRSCPASSMCEAQLEAHCFAGNRAEG